MFSPFFKYIALALVIAGVVAQSTLTINIPTNVVTCEPLLLSWTGGQGPFEIHIYSTTTTGGDFLENLGSLAGNSITFTPTDNTPFVVNIRDGTGLFTQSDLITVGVGSSCPSGAQKRNLGRVPRLEGYTRRAA